MSVESARYWLSWLEFGSQLAIILVVVGVGYDFVERVFARPLHKIIDDARQMEIAHLNNDTERLRADNLALTDWFTPRSLPIFSGPSGALAALTVFCGMPVVIRYVPEYNDESKKYAESIAAVLAAAKWAVQPLVEVKSLMPGVHIITRKPQSSEHEGWDMSANLDTIASDFKNPQMDPEDRSFLASRQLVEYFKLALLEAVHWPEKRSPELESLHVTPDVVLIDVGPKTPPLQLLPRWFRENLSEQQRQALERTEQPPKH
jgi:hypothetical protein